MESQMKMINQAYESNERLIHVVNDLLNASRIQDGDLPFSPKPTKVESMLNELKPGIVNMCKNRKLKLTITCEKSLPELCRYRCDFRQAFLTGYGELKLPVLAHIDDSRLQLIQHALNLGRLGRKWQVAILNA